ncbi:GerAB/ArcD/ProY family transporter [Paenibacillus faecis]|uniref:GerAB/ArcD/ProY family transporter n=1 Tax=Paenibacillus faecis TaxID=862114 RepID=A0A5D0CZA7_9BACL|nr:GerAB/ArcD/ProY family transporter [Paenibacillus faecis]TYA15311.1 GerAB/ArcD/ProY family transporter [Paenibacillus faecis]
MSKEKLHRFQIAMLLFNTQCGVAIFILPRLTAIHLGTNGWLGVALAYLVVSLNIMLITLVYRMGRGASIFRILGDGLPRFLLVPLYLVLAMVLPMIGCIVIKEYVVIYQILMFPQTSEMVLKLFVDLVVFLMVTKGIYNMSKANLFFVAILLTMVPASLTLISNFDFVRLTPFIFKEGKDVVQGIFRMYAAFLGYELFIFLFPYAENNKKWLKYLHLGNALTGSVYLLVTVLCYGFFNYNELTDLAFPLLDMFGYLKFPFIERVQNFLYSAFLLSIVTTASMYYWSGQIVVAEIFPRLPGKGVVFILMAGSILVAMIPKTLPEVEKWFGVLLYFESGVAFGLPLLALLSLLIQKGRKSHA